MNDPMDQPDDAPSIVITTTYPEGSTPDEIIEGRGSATSVIGTSIPPFAVVTAALRAAEAGMAERVRDELESQRGPLTPAPDDEVLDTLVALNARLALVSLLTEMDHLPSNVGSFSIEE